MERRSGDTVNLATLLATGRWRWKKASGPWRARKGADGLEKCETKPISSIANTLVD